MAKKKNKTELASSLSVSEPPADSLAAPMSAAPPAEMPATELAADSPESMPAFLMESGPQLAPSPVPEPAAPTSASRVDPATSPVALAQPEPPMAMLAPELSVGPLLERVRKLEDALSQLQNLQGIEQRVAERVATQLQREKPPAEPAPSTLSTALLDAGKHLLPVVTLPAAGPGPPLPYNAPTAAQRLWLLWDAIAEIRAIIRMYVDPRYSLSWMGRTVPLILLGLFLTTQWWVPFASVAVLGWIPIKAAEIVIGFFLFKVLGYEARRYRETAPDLPPNLRL